MARMVIHATMLVLVLLAMTSLVSAGVPQLINYQGQLTDGSGDPVDDGSYQIKFKIYGSPDGYDSLWWSGFQSVSLQVPR